MNTQPDEIEIVNAQPENNDDPLSLMLMDRFDAKALAAMDAISSGKVPQSALQTHPGKGGKTFTYISHIWATRTMNEGLRYLWGMRVLNYQVFDDASAVALVELVTDIPQPDGKFYRRVISEVGAFESKGDGMKKAFIVAAAASRGLLRCMLRAFNIGSELYEEDEEMTPKMAWNTLKEFGEKRGLKREEIIEALKVAGIASESLVERYMDAWKVIYAATEKKAGKEEVPGEL